LNEERALPRTTKLLLGLTLLLFAPFAVAQNTLGELLDGGAKKISPDEFRQEVALHPLVGITPTGVRMEVIYASSGAIQGRMLEMGTIAASLTASGSIDGVWNVDDSGRICTSMMIGRIFLPFRCEYWFKYKGDYFLALSDSDPKAKLLRRTVKQ
jgi:hypothetical protein